MIGGNFVLVDGKIIGFLDGKNPVKFWILNTERHDGRIHENKIPCTAIGKFGEEILKRFKEGSKITLWGRISSDQLTQRKSVIVEGFHVD